MKDIRRASEVSVAAFVMSVFILAGLVWMMAAGVGRSPITLVPSIESGFVEKGNGIFRTEGEVPRPYMLAFGVQIEAGRDYEVKFTVNRPVRGTGQLIVDLMAPGYDDDDQERHLPVRALRAGSDVRRIINAGPAPERALLRVFYSGAPGLEISRVEFVKLPFGLRTASVAAGLAALLSGAVFAWTRFRLYCEAMAVSRSPRVARVNGYSLLVLTLVYAISAIAHHSAFLLTPYWSGDEYIYKSIGAALWEFGRAGKLTAEAIGDPVNVPNLLYPFFISPAFWLGNNFYSGIRLLNAFAMSSAIFPLFLIARRYVDAGTAVLIAAFAIWIPFMWLGAYAVTEVLFYPMFIWNAWAAVRALEHWSDRGWHLTVGLLSGVLINIRPNGFVVLIAYVGALAFVALRRRQGRSLLTKPLWLLALVGFAASYLGGQVVLGAAEFGSFGFYGPVLEKGDWIATLRSDIPGALNLFLGHIATLAIPYSLPIGILVSTLPWGSAELRRGGEALVPMLCIVCFAMVATIGLTVAFTVRVAPFDLGGLGRIHARYYFPVLPLLLLASVAAYKNDIVNRRALAGGLAFAMICVNVYYIRINNAVGNPWFGSLVDSMEVQWYRHVSSLYWPMIVAYLALIYVFVRWPTKLPLASLVFLVAYLAVSNYGTARDARFGHPEAEGECGRVVAEYLRVSPGTFAVVADTRPSKVAAAFWIPYTPRKTLVAAAKGPPVHLGEILETVDFVVVSGTPSLADGGLQPKLIAGACRVYGSPG